MVYSLCLTFSYSPCHQISANLRCALFSHQYRNESPRIASGGTIVWDQPPKAELNHSRLCVSPIPWAFYCITSVHSKINDKPIFLDIRVTNLCLGVHRVITLEYNGRRESTYLVFIIVTLGNGSSQLLCLLTYFNGIFFSLCILYLIGNWWCDSAQFSPVIILS